MLSAFYDCCIYSNAHQTNFIMKANTMNTDHTAALRNSLILVHIVWSIDYQSTLADEKADDNCREWKLHS